MNPIAFLSSSDCSPLLSSRVIGQRASDKQYKQSGWEQSNGRLGVFSLRSQKRQTDFGLTESAQRSLPRGAIFDTAHSIGQAYFVVGYEAHHTFIPVVYFRNLDMDSPG